MDFLLGFATCSLLISVTLLFLRRKNIEKLFNIQPIPNIKGGYNTKPSTPKLESLKIKSPYTKCITCKNKTCVNYKRKGE